MTEFATDIDAAKNFIAMNVIEARNDSTQRFTLTCKRGNPHVANRGTTSVMGIGEALAELRNAAGLNPGQIAIARDDDQVVVETTLQNWNQLRNSVLQPERRAEPIR